MNVPLLDAYHNQPHTLQILSSRTRTRLLNYYLRWELYSEALQSLEHLELEKYVSLQDLYVRTLLGLERSDEAVHAMRRRLEQRDSASAQVLLGRCLLANKNYDEANLIADTLLSASREQASPFALLGEIHWDLGQVDQAERAYIQFQQLAPNSRVPLLGLMKIHEHREDILTAMAYAVRAFHVEENGKAISIPHLRELRAFFLEHNEERRADEALAEQESRRHDETSDLQTLIAKELKQELTPAKPISTTVRPQTPKRITAPTSVELPKLSDIPASDEERSFLLKSVEKWFGYDSLLSAQPQIMACALRGEHVLAIMPTGAGKSLCYQLPAMLSEGVTLVVSPLIALMKDQVDSLPEPVRAQTVAINSTISAYQLRSTINDIAGGRYKLVYTAPERLRQPTFLHALRHAGLARLVIDEAHCISVWGHDFRPDYLCMSRVHRDLGEPPILAMTATAPPLVRKDIERQLFAPSVLDVPSLRPLEAEQDDLEMRQEPEQREFRLVVTDTYRPNLRLQAIRACDEDEKLLLLLGLCYSLEGSGIIYARTRRQCEQLATLLRYQGFSADHYHAGIRNRGQVQNRFMSGEVQIIVATIAFGMGVDKSDIRFIIHYGLPKSIDGYYQEAGRAGRDGEVAHCVMLYTHSDKGVLTRQSRENTVPVEFLRKVYGQVRRWLHHTNPSFIPTLALTDALDCDETNLRVALSILEKAELLYRHYDLPEAVTLQRSASSVQHEEIEAFSKAVGLPPQQRRTFRTQELAHHASIPLPLIETTLLDWQAEGHLVMDTRRRGLLLEFLPPPDDASTRIQSLLHRYATLQEQRSIEVTDYCQTFTCRHGHLARYLGSPARRRCNACDNCQPHEAKLPSSVPLPPFTEQCTWALKSLSEGSWDRKDLKAVLRGDPVCGQTGKRSEAFARLGFRSSTAVEKLLDQLIDARYIQEVQGPSGSWQLRLTPNGQEALEDHSLLQQIQ